MNREIEKIIENLETMLHDKEAEMFIVVESGFDESGFVGTKDAYLRLAKSLLEFVVIADAGELQNWNLNSRKNVQRHFVRSVKRINSQPRITVGLRRHGNYFCVGEGRQLFVAANLFA